MRDSEVHVASQLADRGAALGESIQQPPAVFATDFPSTVGVIRFLRPGGFL